MSLATPWWVNLVALIPVASFLYWRAKGLPLALATLIAAAAFGIAFGFVEAAAVLYLRSATGPIPAGPAATSAVASQAAGRARFMPALRLLPERLEAVEKWRELATMVMLVSVAILGAKNACSRLGVFLWTFAIWDIAYYAGLFLTVHWPSSLRQTDVLFLVPVPWTAEVWFPLAVSGLTLAAVLAARKPAGG